MSYCNISRNLFVHNINQLTKYIQKPKIGIVLKDNAYGHGLIEIANIAKDIGIKHAIVKDLNEANLITKFFDTILVLYDLPITAVDSKISITINSLSDISKIPSKTSVELKVDTGMHRNGIVPEELHQAINKIKQNELILTGVFTHFASANENSSSIFIQKQEFDIIVDKVLNYDWKIKPRFHCSNTAGTVRFDNNQYDLVRIGLGVYGYIDIFKDFGELDLKPILSLWADKISTRKLLKNEPVGYGGAYTASQDIIISSYDIGYADGMFRLDENQLFHLQNGNPILGRMSMDNFTSIGSEDFVCVFSDAKELALLNGTIIYEILVRINQNLERIVIE